MVLAFTTIVSPVKTSACRWHGFPPKTGWARASTMATAKRRKCTQDTLVLLQKQATQQRLPENFMECASPLFLLNKKQRKSVVDYLFDVASDFSLHCDTVLKAIQLFDMFTLQWNRETNEEWNRAEKAVASYKKVLRIVLLRGLNPDCADHVLSYIQRPEITDEMKTEHFKRMRDLAEETCIVCLSLASKFSERAFVSYKDMLGTLDNRITTQHLVEHEHVVLEKIGWKLNVLSAYQFEDLLYKQIGFTPDDEFTTMMKRTMTTLAPLHELQHKSACVIAAVAILSVFRRIGPEGRYAKHLELLAAACCVSGREAVELEEDVAMAVRLLE
jgi:hypothetical protein